MKFNLCVKKEELKTFPNIAKRSIIVEFLLLTSSSYEAITKFKKKYLKGFFKFVKFAFYVVIILTEKNLKIAQVKKFKFFSRFDLGFDFTTIMNK